MLKSSQILLTNMTEQYRNTRELHKELQRKLLPMFNRGGKKGSNAKEFFYKAKTKPTLPDSNYRQLGKYMYVNRLGGEK